MRGGVDDRGLHPSQALATLGVLDNTTLGSAFNTLRLPSPFPHAEHVARIAHDLALSAGAELQGVRSLLARRHLPEQLWCHGHSRRSLTYSQMATSRLSGITPALALQQFTASPVSSSLLL